MNEIKVGEYVRTEKGIISKVNSGVDIDMLEFENAIIGNIKAHSKDIIDLIEARDFVNGERVTDIMDNGVGTEMGRFIAKEHIDTILTHEMYEQNCYKVGG